MVEYSVYGTYAGFMRLNNLESSNRAGVQVNRVILMMFKLFYCRLWILVVS